MTIEEYLESKVNNLYFIELLPESRESCFLKEDVAEMLREFTQIHVEKALQKAANEVKLKGTWGRQDYSGFSIAVRDDDGAWIDLEIDNDSILNCYKNEIK